MLKRYVYDDVGAVYSSHYKEGHRYPLEGGVVYVIGDEQIVDWPHRAAVHKC